MKQLLLLPAACRDLENICEWYELQSPGLGARFKSVVHDELLRIQTSPTMYLNEEVDLKKAYLPRFPHKILFVIEEDNILVTAIADMRRMPGYYDGRPRSI